MSATSGRIGPGGPTPHYGRVTQIILDHLFHAERFPDRIAAMAEGLECSPAVALACAIAENLCEEFDLVAK